MTRLDDARSIADGDPAAGRSPSARRGDSSARPDDPPVRPEDPSARPEGQSARPEGQSARPEGQSARPEDQSARRDDSSVRPDAGAAHPFRSVGFNLSSLGYAVSRRFRATLAPLRLEPREFALLRAVEAAEGVSQQAVSERLQIPASRMVAFVDALQQRGLLERRPNLQDRRAHALYLTGEGRDLLTKGMTAAVAFENELCANLRGDEREQLLDLLFLVAPKLGLRPGTHSAHSALADELP